MRRTVLMGEPSGSAMVTASVDVAPVGRGRYYAVIDRKKMRQHKLPARVGVCTTSENFNWVIFPDMVLRPVPQDSVEGMFRFGDDGAMAQDELHAMEEGLVRAGWAKTLDEASHVSTEFLAEMRAMDVRLDG